MDIEMLVGSVVAVLVPVLTEAAKRWPTLDRAAPAVAILLGNVLGVLIGLATGASGPQLVEALFAGGAAGGLATGGYAAMKAVKGARGGAQGLQGADMMSLEEIAAAAEKLGKQAVFPLDGSKLPSSDLSLITHMFVDHKRLWGGIRDLLKRLCKYDSGANFDSEDLRTSIAKSSQESGLISSSWKILAFECRKEVVSSNDVGEKSIFAVLGFPFKDIVDAFSRPDSFIARSEKYAALMSASALYASIACAIRYRDEEAGNLGGGESGDETSTEDEEPFTPPTQLGTKADGGQVH